MITNAFMFGFQARLGAMVAELLPAAALIVLLLGFFFLITLCASGWNLAKKQWDKKDEH